MTSDSARPCVLVVEDDRDVRLTTSLVLQAQGFTVREAESAEAALSLLAHGSPPDIAVVDVAMPGMDGIRLTKLLRDRFGFPVLLLTARDLPSDVVTGLDSGADDYVTKPFDGEVLAARLRALLRRHAYSDSLRDSVGEIETFGSVTVDRPGRMVTVGGTVITLSATEFRLLEFLLDNSGLVMSRSQIVHAVWGNAEWIDDRVVDTNIGRLRSKLNTDAIQTVRGFGYKLVAG